MLKKTLRTISPGTCIYSNGEDVLLIKRDVWLFRKDGTAVVKIEDVSYPRKVIFLPGRKALIDVPNKKEFTCISTEDGSFLWQIQKAGENIQGTASYFVASSDYSIIYDYGYTIDEKLFVDRISIADQGYIRVYTEDCLRTTPTAYCDKNDVLCMLQQHAILENTTGQWWMHQGKCLHQLGILACPFENGDAHPYWQNRWTDDYRHIIAANERYVLLQDLSVWDWEEKKFFSLIGEAKAKTLPKATFVWDYDEVRKLLTVCYLIGDRKLVVDVANQKILGDYQFLPEDKARGYARLIDNAFWVSTSKGVVRLPFPNV